MKANLMKLLFFLPLLFAETRTAKAQWHPAPKHIIYQSKENKRQIVYHNNTFASPYWYNDFSNPSDWILENASNPSRDWQIGTSPLPYIGVLYSTSGGNFAGFDSQSDGPNSSQDATIRIKSPIDCSPLSSVQIQFEQVYMHFMDQVFVEVSNDSVNWDAYPVNTALPVNQMTANPDLVSVDISATAAAQSKVWIGFRFYGAWDYAWAVDDIAIQAPPDNDLKLGTAFFKGSTGGSPTQADSSWALYYTQIPNSQSVYDTLIFAGSISNEGIVTQPNTRLVTKISGTAFYSDSSSMTDLSPNSHIYPEIASSYFIPYDTGYYDIEFKAVSDSADASILNNKLSYAFHVTDTVYARDNGMFGNGAGFSSKWAGGNVFHILSADSITSLAFAFHSSTTPGAKVSFHVYDTTDLSNPLVSISNYTLNGNDTGDWLVIPLDSPYAVGAGVYLVAFEQLNDSDVVSIVTGQNAAPAPPLTSLVDVQVDGQWAYAGFTPFVRLHLAGNSCPQITVGFSVILADCDSSDGQATATPAGGYAPYAFQWDANAGSQTTQTATGLAAGVYSVTVTDSLGCYAVETVLVNNITTPIVTDSIGDAICYGQCNGSIQLNVIGNAPFSFLWSNGDTVSSISGLCPGTYFLTVTDSLGCKGVFSYVVNQPAQLQLTMTQTQDYGNGSGTATANPSGGTSPYTFQWDANTGNQTSQTATGLSGGNYSVTVTDSSGCTITGSVVVSHSRELKKKEWVRLYPNPFQRRFTLEIDKLNPTEGRIIIFNAYGSIVKTLEIQKKGLKKFSFDLSNSDQGIYFLLITTPKGTWSRKLIKMQ